MIGRRHSKCLPEIYMHGANEIEYGDMACIARLSRRRFPRKTNWQQPIRELLIYYMAKHALVEKDGGRWGHL